MPRVIVFWFWDYKPRENCVLSHPNVFCCVLMDLLSVHVFMADYSYFYGKYFAPCAKLVSQFIVTSACFNKVVFNVSSDIEYNCGKDSHVLFLNNNAGHCAAKETEVEFCDYQLNSNVKKKKFICFGGGHRIFFIEAQGGQRENTINVREGSYCKSFKMRCPN